MKHLTLLIAILLCLPVSGQPGNFLNRKPEIEKLMENVYSMVEFQRIADSLQLSVSELSYYPVIFPVRFPYISSGYGKRNHPIYRVKKFHAGIDFAEAKDTPVYAAGNGIVISKGYDSGYGNFIEIEHSGGFRSFYAHLSRALVNTGDSVRMGKYIANVGNSVTTTGYHLHYEIRKGNRYLNPIEWCCYLLGILKSVHIESSQS